MNESNTAVIGHSQFLPSALADMIEAAYGLSHPIQITLLRAWTNDVYAVSGNDAHYILKVYRAAWRRSPDVAWEVALQAWLAGHGGLAPSVVPLANGELFNMLPAPEGPRCFALFHMARGHKPRAPWSPALWEAYGRGAALLHQAADGFNSPLPRFSRTLDDLLDSSVNHITTWLADRPLDVEIVCWVSASAGARLSPLLPELDWGICHGDLSLDNLHMLADGYVTLYDFDSSCHGWRAWDVCNALGYAESEHQDGFLRGYRSVRPFSDAEIAAVPFFTAADELRMMADEITRWSEWFGRSRVESYIDEKLDWLRTWHEGIK